MADIVLGVGSSHTPQLSSSASYWSAHAERDQANMALLGTDGAYHSYAELLEGADASLESELNETVWSDKFDRGQRAVQVLAETLARYAPDVVVIVGDDQHELFGAEGVPAIGLFLGEELWDMPPSPEHAARIPRDIQAASWAAHADEPEPYPVDAGLSSHLATSLTVAGFDLTIMTEQPHERGLGHAFTFVRRRLDLDRATPIVPILLNTYFPPNVPSPARCYQLGVALREAISAYAAPTRVALFASGGLSHFVVNEALDGAVIEGFERHDGEALSKLPIEQLRSGNSETLNWVTIAGALDGLHFNLVDYIPAYRSPAGTGVGMAFALWEAASVDREATNDRASVNDTTSTSQGAVA